MGISGQWSFKDSEVLWIWYLQHLPSKVTLVFLIPAQEKVWCKSSSRRHSLVWPMPPFSHSTGERLVLGPHLIPRWDWKYRACLESHIYPNYDLITIEKGKNTFWWAVHSSHHTPMRAVAASFISISKCPVECLVNFNHLITIMAIPMPTIPAPAIYNPHLLNFFLMLTTI